MNNLNPLIGFNRVVNLADAEPEVITAVQKQLSRIGYTITIDGICGQETLHVFKLFKKNNHLAQEAVLGATTIRRLLESPSFNKFISHNDYQNAAELLRTEIAVVKAVVVVEANGRGFLNNGKPKILFEAHWFDKFTKGQFRESHPNLSSFRWNRNLYTGGINEYKRLEAARQLDPVAANKSTSWGLGQIMGFNYPLCGYAFLDSFLEAMHKSEGMQLLAMCSFIRSQKLDGHLRTLNWEGFARGYNGVGYRANNYDVKLANAYRTYSQE